MTIENTIKNFASNLGNGAKMGEHLAVAIDHVIENRDTTPIVKMINAAKRKGDTQAEKAIKFTFGQIYIGAKSTKTKTGTSIKIKDATLSNAGVDTLKKLVASGVSMRGNNWAKAFKTEEDTPDFDVAAWAAKQVKSRPDQLEAMIAALQAQRPSVKKAA